MNEMEELSKIKYSLEGLIKKRIDIIQKDSIESRFAQSINNIVAKSKEANP